MLEMVEGDGAGRQAGEHTHDSDHLTAVPPASPPPGLLMSTAANTTLARSVGRRHCRDRAAAWVAIAWVAAGRQLRHCATLSEAATVRQSGNRSMCTIEAADPYQIEALAGRRLPTAAAAHSIRRLCMWFGV